ncbi:Signal transduction histidine-protein kinase BarA [Planctomycetes bacterium Pan216]|uniref:histidine kinase n=1 Tax=Kolteria novifilia TaxID=2527975 RepID=A0A518B4U6_9BACT|nr:Signal transduction histidine-protein kinase BarA [Planctomycetes bacterium Pan216]
MDLTGNNQTKRAIWAYSIAVLGVVAAVLWKYALTDYTVLEESPFLLFAGSVMLAAWFGGLGPGLVALALSSVIGLYLDVSPDEDFRLNNLGEGIRLGTFFVEGLFICVLCEAMYRSRRREITRAYEAQKASQERRISDDRFRQLVRIGGIGVCTGNLKGEIFEANDVLMEMLGLERGSLTTQPLDWKELTPPEYHELDARAVNEVQTLGRCEPFEKEYYHASGRRIPILIGVTKLDDSEDGFIAFIFDRSKNRQSQLQLAQAEAAADEARQVKVDFLANTSHELRTPMNAIIGMTDLALTESGLPERAREYLQTSRQAADDLLNLINDILDYSKLGSKKFTLETEDFVLRDALDRLLKTLSLRASEKGLELACWVDPNVPDIINGDPLRLRQLILNLASNAVKFTEKGEVILAAKLVREENGHVVLRFSVRDTGPGIPVEARDRILEPFSQLDSSTTRMHDGSGLGLTIAKELAELMEGRIWFESELEQGTTFFVEVKLSRPVESERDAPAPESIDQLKGLRVLVVDDNKANRQILRDMLENWEMKPEICADAAEAMDLVKQKSEQGEPFQVLLVDALMPKVDGFTLIERINVDQYARDPVILMLSSADAQMFSDRCEELCIDNLLEKPISQSDLYDAIASSIGPVPKSREVITQRVKKETLRPLSILVAEDTKANQIVVQRTLERRGHDVAIAVNGRDAIDRWKDGSYDVVLMDVQMPALDGLQATVAIRSLEEGGQLPPTPIIAMTAHAMRGDRQRCLDVGMDDYIAKPIDVRQLVDVVERHASPSDSGEGDPAPPEDVATHSLIHFDAALDRMGGDESLLKEMAQIFLEDADEHLTTLRNAIEENDLSTAERSAHSLKGLSANFEANGVVDLAYAIEKQAFNGESEGLAKRQEQLRELIGQLQEELRTLLEES